MSKLKKVRDEVAYLGDVYCMNFITKHLILVGCGSHLLLYDIDSPSTRPSLSCNVLEGERVHGVRLWNVKVGEQWKLAIFGATTLKSVDFILPNGIKDLAHFIGLSNPYRDLGSVEREWILDVHFIISGIILLAGYALGGRVDAFCTRKQIILFRVGGPKECLFYSLSFYCLKVNGSAVKVRIAAGNVMHSIAIWDVRFSLNQFQLECSEVDNYKELNGHEGSIFKIAWDLSRDGDTIASVSDDRTVRVWNCKSGEQILCLMGHKARIWDVVFLTNPFDNASLLLTCGEDFTTRLWDVDHKLALLVLSGQRGKNVWTCSSNIHFHYHPLHEGIEDCFITSAGADSSISVWNLGEFLSAPFLSKSEEFGICIPNHADKFIRPRGWDGSNLRRWGELKYLQQNSNTRSERPLNRFGLGIVSHGREIHAALCIEKNEIVTSYFILTASEDSHLHLLRLTFSSAMPRSPIFSFIQGNRAQSGSIRCLSEAKLMTWSREVDDAQLKSSVIFSAGSQSHLCCWKLIHHSGRDGLGSVQFMSSLPTSIYPGINRSCKYNCLFSFIHPILMNVAYVLASDAEAACNIYRVDLINFRWLFVNACKCDEDFNSPILCLKVIEIPSIGLFSIAGATNGSICIFDITHAHDFTIISHRDKDKTILPLLSLPVHTSGVNCLDIMVLTEGRLLLITGGDDQSIHVSMLHFYVNLTLHSTEVVLLREISINSHSSSVKDISFDQQFGESRGEMVEISFLSIGSDQRIVRWMLHGTDKVLLRSDIESQSSTSCRREFSVSLKSNSFTIVAEPNSMQRISESSILVIGDGLELVHDAREPEKISK